MVSTIQPVVKLIWDRHIQQIPHFLFLEKRNDNWLLELNDSLELNKAGYTAIQLRTYRPTDWRTRQGVE